MPEARQQHLSGKIGELRIHQVPFALRWFTLWSCTAMPYLFYLGVTSILSSTYGFQHSLVWSISVALLAVTVYAWLLFRRLPDTVALVAAIVVTCLGLIGWSDMDGFSPILAFEIPFVAFTLLRVRRLVFAQSASEQNRRMFRTDSIVLIMLVPLFALSQPGASDPGMRTAGEIVSGITILYVFARIYTLWRFERVETGTRRASRAGLYILIAAAVVLAVGTPFILLHAFFALFALVLPLALLFAGFLELLGFHLHARTLSKRPMPKRIVHPKQPQPHPLQHVPQHSITVLAIIAGVILAVIIIGVLIRTSKGRLQGDASQQADETEATVERTWMFRDREMRFLRTQDPVRLRYQQWLRRHAEKGHPLRPSETPHQYALRMTPEDPEAQDLTAEYEHHRYGHEE
ncbi:MAG: DUF4129 domain-containing protein [Alicyclobacillus sp.]|nr:DUF4129 domain-containing protein [Alicyclobacillus sp.]